MEFKFLEILLLTITSVILLSDVVQSKRHTPQFCPQQNRNINQASPASATSVEITDEDASPHLINLNEFNGRKVKIQFFYPPKPISAFNQRSTEDFSSETNLDLEVTTMNINRNPSSEETEDIKADERVEPDVLCEWEFKVKF